MADRRDIEAKPQVKAPRRPAPALRQRIYIPERARALLARGLDTGLMHVQAPAGCGKTAVVLQFLQDEEIDPHWYTCSRDDADAASLLSGLVRALGGVETTGGQTALAAIASRDVQQSYRVALSPFLADLAADAETARVLIIDDADAIIDSPASAEALDYLLTALSPAVRIMVISRAELPLPSQAKRVLDGSSVRIVADDLLLREDEIGACAADAYGISVSVDEVAALFHATAGWGIALRLALRLRDLGVPLRGGERALFTPEARADLFAYLAAEVLSKVDDRIGAFLRRTAVLETLDPAACARLTGEERPVELIQSLAGAGLPVMKAGWSAYRCHALLREYLLSALTETELREAHRAAGRAYADIGEWLQALEHFAAAGDPGAALAIADAHGRELFFAGNGRALLELVKSAPDELLEVHARAHYWAAYAASRMFQLDWAAAAFERVHAVATARGDRTTAFDALRALAYMLNGGGRFAPATVVAQRLLDSVPKDDVAQRAAVTLGYLTTGMGATNQFREAIDVTRKLLPDLLVEPRADPALEAYARAVSAVTIALEGDFSVARAELHQARMLISDAASSDLSTYIPWSLALVEFQAGNADGADDASHIAEDLALQLGDLQRVLQCRAIRASTAVLRGNVDEADRGFAQLDELRGGGPDFWGTLLTLLSRPHRLRMRGDLAGALAAAEANNALAVATASAWFSCSTRLDVANFRLLTGDAVAARDHAQAALGEATELSNDLLLFGAHLMVAATNADDESRAMGEALRVAELRDFRFLMPYGVRLPQLDAALWRGLGSAAHVRAAILLAAAGPAAITSIRPIVASLDEPSLLRAVDVLRGFGADSRRLLRELSVVGNRRIATRAKEALAALDAANPHSLSARELEVLQLLAQGMRTKDIAGQLVLTPATVSTHLQRIMTKTGTASRAELLALAAREIPLDTA